MSVALVGVGLSAAGAYMNSQAISSAADAQTDAANRAANISQGNYLQNYNDLAPYRQAGVDALGQIKQQLPDMNRSFSMADFQNDPGYQFRMDEGNKAIERSAAARGGIGGGATLKALDRYSQGVASDEFNNAYSRFNTDRSNRFNRLASVAGIGQTGVGQSVQAGQANATNQINAATSAGNASSAASIAQGNNINGALSNGINSWMKYSMMGNSPSGSTYSNPAAGFQGSSYFSNGYGE